MELLDRLQGDRCQLKARQSYEQQSGLASHFVGAAFWGGASRQSLTHHNTALAINSPGLRPGAFCCEPSPKLLTTANRHYDRGSRLLVMGLLYELIVDTEAGTSTIQIEANSKEEALENGQELYPGCRLALVNPEPGEQNG